MSDVHDANEFGRHPFVNWSVNRRVGKIRPDWRCCLYGAIWKLNAACGAFNCSCYSELRRRIVVPDSDIAGLGYVQSPTRDTRCIDPKIS